MEGRGIITAYNPSLGYGIVDSTDEDGSANRYEITNKMLPNGIAGLRAGQMVKLLFEGEDLLMVEPAFDEPTDVFIPTAD